MNDWLPRVADLVDSMKHYWSDLVPKNTTYIGRGEILFNCIHALMSHQLHGLILRSLQHLYETINRYKVNNMKLY